MTGPVNEAQFPVVRPWYREPWPWVLIAIPLLTIIACAFTFWLAISYPDYLVLDEQEYGAVKAGLSADRPLNPRNTNPAESIPAQADVAGQAAEKSHVKSHEDE